MKFCTFSCARTWATLSIAALTLTVANAQAALTTSTSDVFEGASVTASSGIGASADRMFLGASPEDDGSSTAFFNDNGIGSVGSVEFSTASDVSLTGITLFAGEDGSALNHRRSMSNFRFLADTDGDTTFETLLINQPINSDYSTQPGNAATVANDLDLTFTFPTTIASSFRAEFTQATSFVPFDGVRVFEVDAIGTAVPEPQSLALFGFASFALLLVRRRSTLK